MDAELPAIQMQALPPLPMSAMGRELTSGASAENVRF
jgi:hypothetical protein